ncbi:MAG TPA: hypothetical protein DEQ34_07850 [Balneolaceae bacterium]|nr:hypothetical protein [Balneolaceae bacterium]|tara:strand:+ start:220244 stop:221437 length:1194 start_codon:yes stop_codon:yes gene_type:complete
MLDLILVGATGFTGRRAAAYFKEHAPNELNWGIAGRNSAKLIELANDLSLSESKIFEVDLLNKDQVEELVRNTKIIVTTAGPFSLYGEYLIGACATSGTHYLDITGEVGFIMKMEKKYGKAARENRAKIIPFCGFDSIPAEITLLHFKDKFSKEDQVTIKSYYTISGGLNGGTLASMLNKFESGEVGEMNDPRLALAGNEQKLGKPDAPQFFGFDRKAGRWSTPFIMGSINSKVVYRSVSLFREFGKPMFESIAYSEHTKLGKWYNPLPFLSQTLTLLMLQFLMPFQWFRKLLKKVGPKPGEGPSEDAIENGFIRWHAFAWSDATSQTQEVEFSYPGDASNKSTVFFLCESALLLAASIQSINSDEHSLNGFLTPSTAFEDGLLNRLTDRGLNSSRS